MSKHLQIPALIRLSLNEQVRKYIEDLLVTTEIKAGDQLPSEKELADRFHVSIGTIRKAMNDMVSEGLLVRHQGIGTFVISQKQKDIQDKFLPFHPDDGQPNAYNASLITFEVVTASRRVAESLGLIPGSQVFHIVRMLSDRGIGCILDEQWLPYELFVNLTAHQYMTPRKCSIYCFYEEAFGVTVVNFSNRIKACVLEPTECEILKQPIGQPALIVERLAYGFGKLPIELRYSKCVTTQHSFYL